MSRGIGLNELASRLDAEEGEKTDVVLSTMGDIRLRVREDQHIMAQFGNGVPVLGGQELDITRFAHSQISSHVQIPAKYYNRMMEKHPDLLVENVERWWNAEPDSRLVRAVGEVHGPPRMRAWLSDRYRLLDNRDFLEAVLTEAEAANAKVVQCNLDDDRMYVKLLTPRQQSIKPGDVVQGGIIVQNSEVGDGRAVVQPFMFRLICSNGMVSETRFAKTHLGAKLELGILSDEALQADAKAIWLQIRDFTRAALSPEHLEETVRLFQVASTNPVRAKAHVAVANVVRRFSLNKPEAQGVLERYLRGNDDTQFGVVNAVTEFAHQGEHDYRRQVELEALGGTLLHQASSAFGRMVNAPLTDEEVATAIYGRHSRN